MSVQAENVETLRLDSENESEYRKRYKLMTELGPDCRGRCCESGRAGLDHAAEQAV
jgi:hypothetical protein